MEVGPAVGVENIPPEADVIEVHSGFGLDSRFAGVGGAGGRYWIVPSARRRWGRNPWVEGILAERRRVTR